MTTYMLGELITQRREKNPNEGLPIWGVSKDGWILPKQKEADTSIYNVFYRKDFVFNPANAPKITPIPIDRAFWDLS